MNRSACRLRGRYRFCGELGQRTVRNVIAKGAGLVDWNINFDGTVEVWCQPVMAPLAIGRTIASRWTYLNSR